MPLLPRSRLAIVVAMSGKEGVRRLRLVEARRAPVVPLETRVRLGRPCLTVADVADGSSALELAVRLAEELAPRVSPLLLWASGFFDPPMVPETAKSRLARAGAVLLEGAVLPSERAPEEAFRELAGVGASLWLCVGEPAIAFFDAPFSVLIGTDAAGARPSPVIRAYLDVTTLRLPLARASLPAVLAAELLRMLVA